MIKDRFKNIKITDAIVWSVILITAIVCGVMYPKLPRIIPTHFDVNGQINGYGPKGSIFVITFLSIALALLMPLFKKIDPKSKNFEMFSEVYDWFKVFIVTFISMVQILMIQAALNNTLINIGAIIVALIGVMFLLLGINMPKIKQNYTFGIKTPWTLRSEEVWDATHKMAGPFCTVAGILQIVFAAALSTKGEVLFGAFMTTTIVTALAPVIFSYIEYRKVTAKGEDVKGGE